MELIWYNWLGITQTPFLVRVSSEKKRNDIIYSLLSEQNAKTPFLS